MRELETRRLRDGQRLRMVVRFATGPRSWREEEMDILHADMLVGVVTSVHQEGGKPRQNLRPFKMAEASPRMFWSLVRWLRYELARQDQSNVGGAECGGGCGGAGGAGVAAAAGGGGSDNGGTLANGEGGGPVIGSSIQADTVRTDGAGSGSHDHQSSGDADHNSDGGGDDDDNDHDDNDDDTMCALCGSSRDPEQTLLCDGPNCDKEYHMYCLTVALTKVPEGAFFGPCCDARSTTVAAASSGPPAPSSDQQSDHHLQQQQQQQQPQQQHQQRQSLRADRKFNSIRWHAAVESALALLAPTLDWSFSGSRERKPSVKSIAASASAASTGRSRHRPGGTKEAATVLSTAFAAQQDHHHHHHHHQPEAKQSLALRDLLVLPVEPSVLRAELDGSPSGEAALLAAALAVVCRRPCGFNDGDSDGAEDDGMASRRAAAVRETLGVTTRRKLAALSNADAFKLRNALRRADALVGGDDEGGGGVGGGDRSGGGGNGSAGGDGSLTALERSPRKGTRGAKAVALVSEDDALALIHAARAAESQSACPPRHLRWV